MNTQLTESAERPPRVLVVDDEQVILYTVSDALRRRKHKMPDCAATQIRKNNSGRNSDFVQNKIRVHEFVSSGNGHSKILDC